MFTRKNGVVIVLSSVLFCGMVWGQTNGSTGAERSVPRNWIVPQSRSFLMNAEGGTGTEAARRGNRAEITDVNVLVNIVEKVATTRMDIALRNPNATTIEAELVMPVPDEAAIKGFAFEGSAAEPTARLLSKKEARGIYEAIVAKARDPAILEFVGCNLLRSSVFPIPAGGTQKIRLTYEHVLPADGARNDYVLPRSESLEYRVPWNIQVKIEAKRSITGIYSPTHALTTERKGDHVVLTKIADDARLTPGPFRLSYLLDGQGLSATLMAYPDPKIGGGYFLLLASPPNKKAREAEGTAMKREVIMVLDRSGSMRGEKFEQVREAALQVVSGLRDGETFNLIVYSDEVNLFAAKPILKNADALRKLETYLNGVTPSGGTNIHDALAEALRQPVAEDALPLVLFLTDGLATTGNTSEIAIRDLAIKANPHNRRIFTFGVGSDVNTPLLDRIASETRAASVYVLPKENVEVKVGDVFKRLSGPILASPKLEIRDEENKPAPALADEMIPGKIPDIFAGEQLIVLGRYRSNKPIRFALSGNYLGQTRTFEFQFNFDGATTKNAFVPRLWASRKIAALVDAVRQAGADVKVTSAGPANDPKIKELSDEIVRLSLEFGVLTEYTAFLAEEGTRLADLDRNRGLALRNLDDNAIRNRSGNRAVSQSYNWQFQSTQYQMNSANAYFDENMNRVSITGVQQINDRALFRRGNQWVDGELASSKTDFKPTRKVTFGSEEHLKLAESLAAQNRQGTLAMDGSILIRVNGDIVLIEK
jgi:Ca-activated chloride channel family protein